MKRNTSLPDFTTLATKNAVKKSFNRNLFCIRLIRIIWIICKIFAGAIVLYTMAGLVPGLRDSIPSFYRIVDAILHILEKICSWELGFLDKIGLVL